MPRLAKIIILLVVSVVTLAFYRSDMGTANKPLDDALLSAVENYDLPQVKSLLSQGADINTQDTTPFRSCTNPSPPGTQDTPLILSVFNWVGSMNFNRDSQMLNFLLERGADPNLCSSNGKTALHFAASQGNSSAVKALLVHGAKIEVRDNHGDTPLIEASYRGHIDVVKLLLAAGAQVNTKGQLGFSALARATGYQNHIEILNLLLAHGAQVNILDKFGATPLHGAADYGRTQALQILLKHGAIPNVTDERGQTPLTLAANYGNKAKDKWQDNDQVDKIAQRKAQMQKLLMNAINATNSG